MSGPSLFIGHAEVERLLEEALAINERSTVDGVEFKQQLEVVASRDASHATKLRAELRIIELCTKRARFWTIQIRIAEIIGSNTTTTEA